MKHWLLKTEPGCYSIDDLARDKRTAWTGVRNYQARNFMTQEMREGDLAIFYHSNAEPPCVVGLARVCSEPHVDETAFDKRNDTYDPRATPEKPIWECIDVEFVEKFERVLSLEEVRKNKKLAKMELLRKGSRLSIQPVAPAEFKELCKMAGAKTKP